MGILKIIEQYGMVVVLLLTIIIFFRGCGVNGDKEYVDEGFNNKLDSIVLVVDGVKTVIQKDLIKEIKIEGLKTEKRTLINTNDIFLTNTRPDARFLEIDKEIEKLEE